MRLIDADALEQEFCHGCQYEHNKYSNCIDCAVANAPTVDAVQVVRCGECKNRDPEDHKCDCGHGILWQLPREDDWFCADGKRREEDDLLTSANHDGEGKE